jgi:hypothetical protein
MNKYLVVFIESRGEVGEKEVVSSELVIKEFCEEMYNEMVEDVIGMCKDEEEVESFKKYLEEFGYCSNQGDFWGVCINEEEGYEVYEIK